MVSRINSGCPPEVSVYRAMTRQVRQIWGHPAFIKWSPGSKLTMAWVRLLSVGYKRSRIIELGCGAVCNQTSYMNLHNGKKNEHPPHKIQKLYPGEILKICALMNLPNDVLSQIIKFLGALEPPMQKQLICFSLSCVNHRLRQVLSGAFYCTIRLPGPSTQYGNVGAWLCAGSKGDVVLCPETRCVVTM